MPTLELRHLYVENQPHKATIVDNLPFENWTEVCGSERLTGAMLDRLTHRVHIIEANGQSYRLEQSRKRLARQKKRAGQD